MENLEQEIEKFRKDSFSVKNIISEFLNIDLDKQKTIELCHLGKFLYKLDKESKIEAITESPDFIIKIGDKICGIEIVNLFKKDIVE